MVMVRTEMVMMANAMLADGEADGGGGRHSDGVGEDGYSGGGGFGGGHDGNGDGDSDADDGSDGRGW